MRISCFGPRTKPVEPQSRRAWKCVECLLLRVEDAELIKSLPCPVRHSRASYPCMSKSLRAARMEMDNDACIRNRLLVLIPKTFFLSRLLILFVLFFVISCSPPLALNDTMHEIRFCCESNRRASTVNKINKTIAGRFQWMISNCTPEEMLLMSTAIRIGNRGEKFDYDIKVIQSYNNVFNNICLGFK